MLLKNRRAVLLAIGALLSASAVLFSSPSEAPLQLWYFHHSYLTTDDAVASSKALIDRAARAGYTGLAFWDNSFGRLSDPMWPRANVERMRQVMQYAAGKGLHVLGSGAPFGWSNIALMQNGNLAEAQRVTGTRFKVDGSAKHLDLVNSLPPLRNAGFEEGRSEWFDTGDAAIGLNGVAHGGKQSGVIVNSDGNARFRQKVSLQPWRQYHLSLWFKSADFHGPSVVEVIDWWHRGAGCFYTEIHANGTHDWTRLDYTFDSRDTSWAFLYFGVWGKSTGTIWFDDIQLEETGPVYVARRPGTPLRLYDGGWSGTVYREGSDFDHITDPALNPPHAVFRDDYHAPIRITLPKGTQLRPGQIVALDYYAVFPIPTDQQVGMCLTEPAVFQWMRDNAAVEKSIMPPDGELLLGYDEMRQANSCASCRAKGMTAGQLLAWNVGKTVLLYHAVMPKAQLYTWSDMFDPTHNATDNYFYVEGSLEGSWKGLPPELGVLNWNHTRLRESLEWFAGMNSRQPIPHHQIIAGYYDSGRGNSAEHDFQVAHAVPGIQGIMYVTWRDDYSQLETFADSARKGWSSYIGSIGRTNSR